MDPLTLGIIVSLGSLFIGGVTAGFDYVEKTQEMEADNEYKKLQYTSQEADELATLSTNLEESIKNETLQNELSLQKLELDYEQSTNTKALEYELNKQKAEYEAYQTDLQLNRTEKDLSNEFNTSLQSLILNQSQYGSVWMQQMQQNDSQRGQQYAQLASNGTRAGSSLGNAVELQSASNSFLLQQQQDIQRKSDLNNINSGLNNLASSAAGISQNRNQADYVRGQYQEGGSAYREYQNSLNNMEASYNLTKSQQNQTFLRSLESLNTLYQQQKTNVQNKYQRLSDDLDYEYNKWTTDSNRNRYIFSNALNLGSGLSQTVTSLFKTASLV